MLGFLISRGLFTQELQAADIESIMVLVNKKAWFRAVKHRVMALKAIEYKM
jgi:hypothetical protein